jgi:hypothetical protein
MPRPILGLVDVDSSYNLGSGLDDFWRGKLEQAQRRYAADPTAESRAEWMRVLRVFANLVGPDQLPPSLE